MLDAIWARGFWFDPGIVCVILDLELCFFFKLKDGSSVSLYVFVCLCSAVQVQQGAF